MDMFSAGDDSIDMKECVLDVEERLLSFAVVGLGPVGIVRC